ncbi:hypothetical protein Y032_1200g3749 [Ancylostoma ceylanicum]|uniref:Uncharacterized protein n=2 Tax=Ancylostoma ceylanicum TaxID=53326 RepID=A0A016W5Y2_9BILA|nr:hypothetical protein Y032_1200g3749 [Ancylostoma ceylanicum]
MARYEYEVCAYYGRKPLTCIMDFLDFQKGEYSPAPRPPNLRLSFHASSAVTVHFDPRAGSNILGHKKGCEVFICDLPEFYGDCIKKRVEPAMSSVSFEKLGFSELYFATTICFSRNIYGTHSPWVMFITPKKSKPVIPGVVRRISPHFCTISIWQCLSDLLEQRFRNFRGQDQKRYDLPVICITVIKTKFKL